MRILCMHSPEFNNIFAKLISNFRDENKMHIVLLHTFSCCKHAVFQAVANSSRVAFEYTYYMRFERDTGHFSWYCFSSTAEIACLKYVIHSHLEIWLSISGMCCCFWLEDCFIPSCRVSLMIRTPWFCKDSNGERRYNVCRLGGSMKRSDFWWLQQGSSNVPKYRVSDDSSDNDPLTVAIARVQMPEYNCPGAIARLVHGKNVLKNLLLTKVSRWSRAHI